MTIIGFFLGTILGSFVKAIADRSLSGKTYLGRSVCPNCKHKLGWLDLFPILSYIFLKGRCRYCGRKISLEYPVVELIVGVLIGFLFWYEFNYSLIPNYYSLIFKTFFITVLAIVFITDIKKYFIPDKVTIPSILISIVYLVLTKESFFENIFAGGLIGGFFLMLIILTRGKGMGGGDVKLGAFMGLGLGLYNGISAVMLGFFLGAVFGISAIILKRKKLKSHLPFGPFLVLGSLIALFWGSLIANLYF